jgi:hypothetical protein
LEERQNVTAVQHSQGTCILGNGVRRSFFAIQNRKLTKHLARLNNRQHQFLAIGGRNANSYGAAQHRHHVVAGRAQIENGLTRLEGADARLGCDRCTLLSVQAAK